MLLALSLYGLMFHLDVLKAAGYGVEIGRADVQDLMSPANLEQVMNHVLTAERTWEAKLIEARAKAEVEHIDAQTRADAQRLKAEAEAQRIKTQAEASGLSDREQVVALYKDNPALLRVLELEALRELAHTATARFYVSFGSNVKVDEKD